MSLRRVRGRNKIGKQGGKSIGTERSAGGKGRSGTLGKNLRGGFSRITQSRTTDP